ncbi:MAG: SUMF1/EgtB/PvdO family nonheme iron enzyme [Candidatus Eremiobacterota bacterium]
MKKFIYILTIIAITAIVIISMVSCGGSGVNNVIPVPSNPSNDTGSLQINVNWPDKTGSLTSSVIHPDVTQIEITITGTGLSSSRVEVINKPDASKTITGLPEGNKDTEFKGKDASDTVISHRKTTVTIIKNQTVTSQTHLGVSILDTGDFYPSSIPISVGDTLYWVNNDDVVHTVTADDSSFDSGDIAAGAEWSRKFDTAGTFGYKCAKTNKAGSVVVGDVDPNSTPTPTPTATITATVTSTPTPTITGPPMVSIAGGTFNMGSNINSNEDPVHSVTLSSFDMGKYEVRNSDYVIFLNSQGNQTEGGVTWIDMVTDQYQGITGGPNPGTFTIVTGYENRPVVYVSWYGTVAYCNWLSSQQGLTLCYGPINNRGNDPSVWRTLNGYRLPTEAEWEYACRGGQTAEYYWGDPYPPDPPNINNYAWYNGNSSGNHHIIGQLLPNGFGLYDMSGNSLEWCSDWYSDNTNNPPNYYVISPSNDPTGPATGSWRVLRSGGWAATAGECRSAYRHFASPDARNFGIGFRLVKN